MAMEPNWNKDKNYPITSQEIINHIKEGCNYGMMVTNGAMVIDCDTQKLYDDIPEEWKKSLTVITGRNGVGRHIFLNCPDSPPEKFAINDPKTDEPLGDMRGTNSKFYTVGSGSIHPDTGTKYKYLDKDAPLVDVKWSEVKSFLDRYNKPTHTSMPVFKTSTDSLSSKLNLRIESFAMPNKPVERSNGDIQGAHPIHGSSTGQNFAINPKTGLWYCFRCGVGGDVISWLAYTKCGVPEKDCGTLTKDQFVLVTEWLRSNGYSEPLVKADLDFLLKLQPLKIDETGLDLEQEIDDARQRFSLPPFPELNDGLFKDYMDFGKAVSYSLEEYHFATLLAIVSMALRRRVLIQIGMTRIYTNAFIMITGNTTISGKSTACDMAINNLAPAVVFEDQFKFQSTNLPTGTMSEAALVQGLADVYHSLWYHDECASFFDDISWNKGILSRMCQVYDGGKIERTLSKRAKNKEDFHVVSPWPFMSTLFNTTNADLERIANTHLFSSGFFPRIMWFYGQGGHPRKNTKVSVDKYNNLKDIFLKVKTLKEEMDKLKNDDIIFEICDMIEEWKIQQTMDRLGGKEDEAHRTAIARGFIHAYKIAAVLTMVDPAFRESLKGKKYPIKLDIPENHAAGALHIVQQYLMPRMVYVHDLCINGDERNHQNIVIKALNHFGGSTTRSKLIIKTRLSSRDLTISLNTLYESGEIVMINKLIPGSDKSTTYIIRKK